VSAAIVLGFIDGMTIGLLAVGIVLVYKANRFINLAHGQLGALSAVLLAKFAVDWGWSWWVAFPVALAVGVVTGLVVERAVIRPLRARTGSTVALLLVTIGVAQILLALVFIPALGPNGNRLALRGYPLPFQSHLTVSGVVLGGQYILVLILIPAIVVALALFLRYATTGKMIRAAASNVDAARLCGVPVSRVSAVAWAVAGGMSAVAAVVQAPAQGSFSGASLGPELLLRALGAAALGGFTSVPAALVGGIGIGVAEQATLQATHKGGTADLVVLGVILAILVARGAAISAAVKGEGAAVQDRPPVRVPASLASRALVRRIRWWLGGTSLVVGALAPLLPYFRTQGHRFELTLVLVYGLVGVAVTMLVGWGGQVSLGHFALVGVGAFLTARLAPHGWSLPLLLVASGALGAAIMAVIGLPALRLRGLTLAVTTLGLAVVAPNWLFRQSWFGSVQPFGVEVVQPRIAVGLGRPTTQLHVYYLSLVILAAVVVAAGALRRSNPGRLIVAVRDNESATASFGVTPATVKLAMLAVSGFVAAMAGVLWADAWRSVATSQFDATLSLSILAVPVIGGLGSLSGSVAGAVALYVPAFFIGPSLSGLFGEVGRTIGFQLALGGIGLVVVLLSYPTGLAGAAQRAWEWFLGRVAAADADRLRTADATPLAVDDVSLSFGGVQALDGATITVQPGEIVGLIGPNGAGKTTLMNVISGTIRPDRGSILLFGEEIVDLPAEIRAAQGLARSFQDAHLFPGLTVTETVQIALARDARAGFASSMLGMPWVRAAERASRAQALEVLDRLGLSAWSDALTSELSTGTRRICDIAAQLAARPRLLLLDEPTAGVAQREAEVFGPLLRRVRDELDCAVLIVEHDMPLLMGLCDRVYAMEAGRVIAEGTPEDVRHDPAVIASYLGTEEAAIARSGASVARTGDAGQAMKGVSA
jgi:ABC-type branched-subunit amino acid transport system ATPase component/ABC-type branched-subunit amino acid transport system permease subunit